MNFNWKVIQKKIYSILKGVCDGIKLFDQTGSETIEPSDANRFFATFKSIDPSLESFTILVAVRDEGQSSSIEVKTPDLQNDSDFEKIRKLIEHIRSSIGQREGIKVNWQDFDRTIDPREEAMNNIKESKDISKIFGTTKSSFQRIGEAKLIIRHRDTVDETKHGARTRQIKALFVENKMGERFAYPHCHMAGARAFARHISNGGTNHDQISEKIFKLSETFVNLRRIKKQLRLIEGTSEWVTAITEGMKKISKQLNSLRGIKGYSRSSEDLVKETVINDPIGDDLQNQIATACGISTDDPAYAACGTAAEYINRSGQYSPLTFSWNRKPQFDNIQGNTPSERMIAQLSELADACSDENSSKKLSGLASNISSGIDLSESDADFIKEAMTSCLSSESFTAIPEENELDEFFDRFDPTNMFSSADGDSSFEVIDSSTDDQEDKLSETPVNKIYPDTEEGAIQALADMSTHNLAGATAVPDPQVSGVWKITRRDGVSIVYLRGYKNSVDVNDFEDINEGIAEDILRISKLAGLN